MNPFCHLVIKAVRVDSPLCNNSTQLLAKALIKYPTQASLCKAALAAKLGMNVETFKNWERGGTLPTGGFQEPIFH